MGVKGIWCGYFASDRDSEPAFNTLQVAEGGPPADPTLSKYSRFVLVENSVGKTLEGCSV
jgi:hypothetical protein